MGFLVSQSIAIPHNGYGRDLQYVPFQLLIIFDIILWCITHLGLATDVCSSPPDGQVSEQEMQLWSVFTIACPVGEAFQDGSATRSLVCLPGGQWSAIPKCERKTIQSL